MAELVGDERQELIREIGERGKVDHHFFCAVIMGATCMSPSTALHGRVCSFLGDESLQRKWLEASRGFMKSTLGTEGTSLREVARDPGEHVLIMSAVEPLAQGFLANIKACVMSPTWKLVYPELRPNMKCWNESKAGIVRPGGGAGAREPSWSAGSLKKGITGGHYTRIKWDDLVIPENVDTREMAAWVIRKFKSLGPVRDSWTTPELMCGTPYTGYDLYAWLKRDRPKRYRRLKVPIMDAEGVPAWPEEYPREAIEDLRGDPEVFWPQYMLETKPPERQFFKRHQFRYFRRPDEPEVRDWSQNDDSVRPVVMAVQDLTLYMGWDPSSGIEGGDESVLLVVGTDSFGNYYLVEVVHGNYSLTDQIDLFFMLQREYPIARTSAEMSGPFASLAGMLESEMEIRGQWYPVEKSPVANRTKEDRVQLVLGRIYQGRKLYHHHLLHEGLVERQILDFPRGGRYDDIPDALAHAVEIAQKYGGYGAVTQEVAKQQSRSSFGLYPRIGFTMEQMESGEYEGQMDRMGKMRKAVGAVGLF